MSKLKIPMKDMLKVYSGYSGMGSDLFSLIDWLKIPPEKIALFATEHDEPKRKMFMRLHPGLAESLGKFQYAKDERGDESGPKAVKEFFEDQRPDLMSLPSSCVGFSLMGKKEGLNNEDSASLLASLRKRNALNPVSYLHEMTGTTTYYNKLLDAIMNMTDDELKELEDKGRQFEGYEGGGKGDPSNDELYKRIVDAGRIAKNVRLTGKEGASVAGRHIYRGGNLDPVMTDAGLYKIKPDAFMDPGMHLNAVNINPNETLRDYLERVGHNPKFQDPDVLSLYSSDNRWRASMAGDINKPWRFPGKAAMERQVKGYPYYNIPTYLTAVNAKDINLDKMNPHKEAYYYHNPSGEPVDLDPRILTGWSLPGVLQNPNLKPGQLYKVSIPDSDNDLGDRMAWGMGIPWQRLRQAGITEFGPLVRLLGDTMPAQQQAIMFASLKGVQDKAPDEVRAFHNFMRKHDWSDRRLKNILPVIKSEYYR